MRLPSKPICIKPRRPRSTITGAGRIRAGWLWSLTFRFREESAARLESGDVSRCFTKLNPREQARCSGWVATWKDVLYNESRAALDLREKSIKVLLFRARRNLERILRQNGCRKQVNP